MFFAFFVFLRFLFCKHFFNIFRIFLCFLCFLRFFAFLKKIQKFFLEIFQTFFLEFFLSKIFLEFLVNISSLQLEKWLSYWAWYEVGHIVVQYQYSSSSDYTVQTHELKLKVRSLDKIKLIKLIIIARAAHTKIVGGDFFRLGVELKLLNSDRGEKYQMPCIPHIRERPALQYYLKFTPPKSVVLYSV